MYKCIDRCCASGILCLRTLVLVCRYSSMILLRQSHGGIGRCFHYFRCLQRHLYNYYGTQCSTSINMWRKIFIFCFLAVQNVAGYPVILLVLDGFLPSYFSSVSTPNLDSLVKDGVRVSRLQPEFPASRDPFLVSLLTGRHSEDHGVFAHERYSTKLDSLLSVEDAAFWNKTRELGTLWVCLYNYYYIIMLSKLCCSSWREK